MASTSVQTTIKRIVFMGTPEFAVPTLLHLIAAGRVPSLVITQPDKPQGRNRRLISPPVKSVAAEHGIPVFQPETINAPEAIEKITEFHPDIIVTAAYGAFLGRVLRDIPDYGCLNLHPSLLPRYRGASPVPFALFDGCTETGVSVFRIVREMDAGPVLYQKQVEIRPEETGGELLARLAELGAEAVLETLTGLETGSLEPIPQDHSDATYTTKIEKSDLWLKWGFAAQILINRVRGLAPEPGAVTGFRGQRLKILRMARTEISSEADPGTIVEVVKNIGIRVTTADRDIILLSVQPEGKRVMSAYEYHLGAHIKPGEVFHADI